MRILPAKQSLVETLTAVGPIIEANLKPQLSGVFGSLLLSFLPQVWVFVTEEGTVSLSVDRSGNVHVIDGAANDPDLTITIPAEKLREAIQRRTDRPPPLQALPQNIDFHTSKGQATFSFLRSRLGL